MNKNKISKATILKILCISLILIIISGIGVVAMATQMNSVTIILQNGYELTVLTSKTNVKDILLESNVELQENEKVTPGLDEKIGEENTIRITNRSVQEIQVAKVSENGIETTLDDILANYSSIIEKIVVEEVTIPYETITKDVSNGETSTKNKVVQEGQEGIKRITSKVKYKNEEEIERQILSEEVIKEPVNKIVQIQKNVTARTSTTTRTTDNTATASTNTTSTSTSTAIYKVTGYCSCAICCGKSASGYTASGTKATAGRTVAASSQFAFGTKLSINGKTYTVEDRGGAIKGNKIDIYFDTHQQALAWGVRYLPVEVVK
ncbi:MAG: G5 domain-containing protein [Clostridia bacterium]|nr:G5 domain-containing protein [Clostridia bacterium]